MAAPPCSATRATVAAPAPRRANTRDIGRLLKRLLQGAIEIEPAGNVPCCLGNILLQMRDYTSAIIVVVASCYHTLFCGR